MITVNEIKDLLKSEFSDQIAAYIDSENPLPEGVIDWLAQLALLYGVPFNNLVPDEKMLPNESIRFFYFDQNWTDFLMDGAISLGIHSGRDQMLQEVMNTTIRQQVDKALTLLRNKISGQTLDGAIASKLGTISGFLMRSDVISNYPGLEIRAFEDTDAKIPAQLLRLERLAPNILLVIFDIVPATIEITAPSEGRFLGVIQNNDGITYLNLRNIDGEVGQVKKDLTFELTDAHFRNKSKRVINVTALQSAIGEALGKPQLSPSEFAIQMMQSPTVYRLNNNAMAIPVSRSVDTAAITLDKAQIFKNLFK